MPMFVGALVLIGFASWFSYSHLKQELRRHLIEHGDYIATTIVESARSVDSYDQIRFALEQISLKTSGLHGVTLASVDPFIIWASSYHPGSNGNEAGRDMLAAMRMVQDAGLFGKFVLPGGDIVITHPLEQDFPDTRANTRRQHNPGQTDFGTFQPIDIFPIPVGEFKGVLYLRLDWETVIANARQHMLTQAESLVLALLPCCSSPWCWCIDWSSIRFQSLFSLREGNRRERFQRVLMSCQVMRLVNSEALSIGCSITSRIPAGNSGICMNGSLTRHGLLLATDSSSATTRQWKCLATRRRPH